MDTTR